MRFENHPRKKRFINITPLIDVVFTLLIFIMLASSFLQWRSVPLNVPARQATAPSMERAVLIRIHTDGSVDFSGEPLRFDDLSARLQQYTKQKPEQRILVQPEGTVRLQQIVTLLDHLAKAGGRNISLTRGQRGEK